MKSVFLSVGKRGLSIVFQLFGGIKQAAAIIELPAELSRNYNNEKRIFINIAFCDFVLQNFDSENFGLLFRSFRFLRQNGAFSTTEQNQTYKNSLFLRNLNAIQQKILPSGKTPYFFTQNPDFIWRQRTEKQKLYIE